MSVKPYELPGFSQSTCQSSATVARMKVLTRWSYVWKPNEKEDTCDTVNLITTKKNSSRLKTFLEHYFGFLQCINCFILTMMAMALIWLLIVAIICHTTHVTIAWPGGSKEALKHDALATNSTNGTESKINISYVEQNKTNSNETSAREKRGTSSGENPVEKREISSFSGWGGKLSGTPNDEKRAKFSSWGGKRADSDDINELYENINNPKRAKFSSWGGKRSYSDDDLEKRAQFSSWAGKRDSDELDEEKRAKFNSWAGKRTFDTMDDKRAKFSSWAGKRGKFNSWAGKRSDLDVTAEGKHIALTSWDDKPESGDLNNYYLNEDKRAKFSSWGGKRNPDYLGASWNSITPDNHVKYYSSGMGESGNENIMKLWQDLMSRKRARFSSWAGKRSEEIAPDMESLVRYLDSDMQDKRAKFSSWAGKREDPEKRKFSSWGGKRDVNESYGELVDEKEGYPSVIVKRSVFTWSSPSVAYKRKPIFSSWGGKRSDAHTIQIRSLPIQRVLIGGGKDRNWGSLMRPIRRGPDFYAWGGKRST